MKIFGNSQCSDLWISVKISILTDIFVDEFVTREDSLKIIFMGHNLHLKFLFIFRSDN